jgi:hypothetical protein
MWHRIGGLCSAWQTDTFFLGKLFNGSIEPWTEAIGRILSALGKPDSWLVALCMGRIDCHTLCIVGIILGNGCALILGLGDTVVKEQIVTFA